MRGYQGEDIEIQLPGDLTVHDIDWISIWCITFKENFGHVMIPKDLDVPPALGQNQLTVSVYPILSLYLELNYYCTIFYIARCFISLLGGIYRYSLLPFICITIT